MTPLHCWKKGFMMASASCGRFLQRWKHRQLEPCDLMQAMVVVQVVSYGKPAERAHIDAPGDQLKLHVREGI